MSGLLIRLGICLCVIGLCLYSYLETQNQLTHLKICLPEVKKEIALIQEENQRLAYEMDRFESPAHLLELARCPEYAHLKHPLIKEILTVPEAFASN